MQSSIDLKLSLDTCAVDDYYEGCLFLYAGDRHLASEVVFTASTWAAAERLHLRHAQTLRGKPLKVMAAYFAIAFEIALEGDEEDDDE